MLGLVTLVTKVLGWVNVLNLTLNCISNLYSSPSCIRLQVVFVFKLYPSPSCISQAVRSYIFTLYSAAFPSCKQLHL